MEHEFKHDQGLQGKCGSLFRHWPSSGSKCVLTTLTESWRSQLHKVPSCQRCSSATKEFCSPNSGGGRLEPRNSAPACSPGPLRPLSGPTREGVRLPGWLAHPESGILHYLFSISTGSASGGCTFTFTSAIRAVLETWEKVAPGAGEARARRPRVLLRPVAPGFRQVGLGRPCCACSALLSSVATRSPFCCPELQCLSD